MTTPDETNADFQRGDHAEPHPDPLYEMTRSALDAWRTRMQEAVVSGRAATTVARMATARVTAELRRIESGQSGRSTGKGPAVEYLRRATAVVSRAAHEIERNRYSLPAMQSELERLEDLYKRLSGGDEAESGVANSGSVDAGSGADDRGADG
jgi:hypothetical protein